jgi:hypothetical protein
MPASRVQARQVRVHHAPAVYCLTVSLSWGVPSCWHSPPGVTWFNTSVKFLEPRWTHLAQPEWRRWTGAIPHCCVRETLLRQRGLQPEPTLCYNRRAALRRHLNRAQGRAGPRLHEVLHKEATRCPGTVLSRPLPRRCTSTYAIDRRDHRAAGFTQRKRCPRPGNCIGGPGTPGRRDSRRGLWRACLPRTPPG